MLDLIDDVNRGRAADRPRKGDDVADAGWRAALDARIEARWNDLWEALPRALDPAESEGVHDMRVASRRLRAALTVGRACHQGKWYRRLQRAARSITQALGAVRDREVQLVLLADRQAAAPPLERAALDRLAARLTREENDARRDLTRTLRRLQRSKAPDETRRRFGSGGPAVAETSADRSTQARQILGDRVRAFYAYEPFVSQPEAGPQLHALRIEAKRLRYTLELVADDLGAATDAPIARIKDLQEALGALHDQDVLIGRLREELARLARRRRKATKKRPAPDSASWGLALALAHARDERRARYATFADAWNEKAAAGLPAELAALSAPPASEGTADQSQTPESADVPSPAPAPLDDAAEPIPPSDDQD